MSYDEFLGIFAKAGLITDIFPERDAISAYAMSMMTQLDELDFDRHIKMTKVEFYEAYARAAESLSLPPPNSIVRFILNNKKYRKKNGHLKRDKTNFFLRKWIILFLQCLQLQRKRLGKSSKSQTKTRILAYILFLAKIKTRD